MIVKNVILGETSSKLLKFHGEIVKKILLFNGGPKEEREITLISCEYLKQALTRMPDYEIYEVMIAENGEWSYRERPCHLRAPKALMSEGQLIPIDAAIPIVHGHPAESGELLACLELGGIPYLGPGHEAAVLSFNKMSAKYWLQDAGVPVTQAIVLTELNPQQRKRAQDFFDQHSSLFIKASSQGSSRGCYWIKQEGQLQKALEEAMVLSPYVLLEEAVSGRELEVAVYQYRGGLHASEPGEIIPPPDNFYSYEEKYSKSSQTQTQLMAQNLPTEIAQKIRHYALQVFKVLKLRDLARVDFFYSKSKGILFNEVNTFPGLTPISMFPQMLEHNGPQFQDFLQDRLNNLLN